MKTLTEIRSRSKPWEKSVSGNTKLIDEIIKITKYGNEDYYDDDMAKIRDLAEKLKKAMK